MERRNSYPREGVPLWVAGMLLGTTLLNAGLRIATNSELNDTEEKLKKSRQLEQQVQVYNADITQELADRFDTVDQLAVMGQDGAFTFTTKTDQNIDQICEGSYDIKNERAVPVGSIACTELVPATDQ